MANKLEYIWHNDDSCDVHFNDLFIANINHDDYDRSAMASMRNTLNTLANAAGFDIVVKGKEGV